MPTAEVVGYSRAPARSLRREPLGPPLPYAMLAFLSLLWGTSFLFIKIASTGFDAFGFALGRVVVAAGAMVFAAALTGMTWPRGRAIWLKLLAMAAVGQVIPFLLLGQAARLTTSADLALMMGAVPIFTFALGRLLGARETWRWRSALGLALGFAGVVVCVGGPGAALETAAAGRVLGLMAALGYALGGLLSRQLSSALGSSMAATASMAASAGLMLIVWLAVDGAALAAPSLPAWKPLAALVILGLFNTALAYLVLFRLIMIAGPTFASLNNYIVPFLGLMLGWLTLNEPIAFSAWIGFALVIAGVVMTGGVAAAPAKVLPSSA